MFPCPRCGRDVPEVLGAAEQKCPHCGVVIGPARPRTGALLAGGLRDLVARAPRWWGLFLGPALAVDAATVAFALASPELGTFLTGCGASPARPGPAFYASVLGLVVAQLAAYFVGWALVASEHAGARRDRAWWARVAAGSALLAVVFTLGLLLAALPALVLFLLFLLAPAALGAGAGPLAALDGAREASRRRPTGFAVACLLVALAAEGLLLAVSCVGGFWTSLALQGLVWWLLAPVVPVLTAHAWARVGQRGA